MPRQLSQSRLSALSQNVTFVSFLSLLPFFFPVSFSLGFISRAREAGHTRARLGTKLPNMDERLNFNQSNLRAKPTSEIRSLHFNSKTCRPCFVYKPTFSSQCLKNQKNNFRQSKIMVRFSLL